jgi:hypothetical protein
VLDVILLSVAIFTLFGLPGGVFGVSITGLARPDTRAKMWSTIRVFQWMAFGGLRFYVALTVHSSRQRALERKVLGLYVTDMAGQSLGFGRATGRYFVKSISNFTLLIGYIITGLQRIGRPCVT